MLVVFVFLSALILPVVIWHPRIIIKIQSAVLHILNVMSKK